MSHHTSQRQALEMLYETAHGGRWRQNARWLSVHHVCHWQGVECLDGEITSIDLGGNRVAGVLPPELASLTKLRVLNIDESHLSGTLPTQLGLLLDLETILLATNPSLSGTLPHSLAKLTKLRTLDVSGSALSGSISGSALRSCGWLQRLQLDHTRLSGSVPTQVGHLTRVQSVFVHESRHLSGTLPTQLGALTALKDGMSFAHTRISGTIPSQLGRASRLRALWLTHTDSLSGTIPPSLGTGMRGLAQLELHRNRLSGSLPTQLGMLSLRSCVLVAAQGPHQPHHSMRPVDRDEADTNRFACTHNAKGRGGGGDTSPGGGLPSELPTACASHLRCHAISAPSSAIGDRHGGQSGHRERPAKERPRQRLPKLSRRDREQRARARW